MTVVINTMDTHTYSIVSYEYMHTIINYICSIDNNINFQKVVHSHIKQNTLVEDTMSWLNFHSSGKINILRGVSTCCLHVMKDET